jgi:glycosyltransferase involved in cell wall biosynthesis
LVVNEALATGLPCVTSDAVGCAPDLIRSDWTGETYPSGDVDALARSLAKVRARLAAGHSYAAGCRDASERHSLCAAAAGISAAARAVRRRP